MPPVRPRGCLRSARSSPHVGEATNLAIVGGDGDLRARRRHGRDARDAGRHPPGRRRLGRRGGTPPLVLRAPPHDPRTLARGARTRGLRRRRRRARARGRLREGAAPVRSRHRHVPGGRASSRRRPTSTSSSHGRSPFAPPGASPTAPTTPGCAPRRQRRTPSRRGDDLRARDPGARRHRVHLGARPPPVLQAGALARRLGGLERAAPRSEICEGRDSVWSDTAHARTLHGDRPLRAVDRPARATIHGARQMHARRPGQERGTRPTTRRVVGRAGRLGRALRAELGLGDGDRVATLCWNHVSHLEVYLGVPCAGLVAPHPEPPAPPGRPRLHRRSMQATGC